MCADLRASGIWTPILMLTAKHGDLDEAEGLDTGADDYLTKPFSFPVLVARIRALLRRGATRGAPQLAIGDVRLDSARRRVHRGASHELRSPLTRIRSELEVDRAHPTTADLAVTHASVLDEVVNLQRLVDDLLVLARNDGDRSPTERATVDLDDIVLEEARRLRQLGGATVDTSGVSAAQVVGDRRQLARAVRNLTDNAAQHAVSTITVELGERGGDAELSIADDGPGIPPGETERIFERFTRLDEARHADAGGTGLGLAIAREIIEGHGGRVVVDATVASGARFVVALPLA